MPRFTIELTPEEVAAARLLLTALLRALEPEAPPVPAPVDPCSRSNAKTSRPGMSISSGSLARLVATPDKPPERPAPYYPDGLQWCRGCHERLPGGRFDGGLCDRCAAGV